MSFAKKLDRAVQWAGEKMGSEAKTTHSDEFQRLEAEMTLRQDGLLCPNASPNSLAHASNTIGIIGMESLHKATTAYSKWISRRCDASEDKSRSTPTTVLGRAMVAHGNDFEPESEFGNSLAAVGRANERISNLHSNYAEDVNANWLHHLDRNVAMMKEYQVRFTPFSCDRQHGRVYNPLLLTVRISRPLARGLKAGVSPTILVLPKCTRLSVMTSVLRKKCVSAEQNLTMLVRTSCVVCRTFKTPRRSRLMHLTHSLRPSSITTKELPRNFDVFVSQLLRVVDQILQSWKTLACPAFVPIPLGLGTIRGKFLQSN